MAERDYKVVYRARPVSPSYDDYEGGGRRSRRIPGALDPYDYPNDRDELKRNVAEARLRNRDRQERTELVDEDYALQPDDSISVRQEAIGDRILRERMERSPVGMTNGSTSAATGNVTTTKTTYSVKKEGAGGDARITGAARSVLQESPSGREWERDRDRAERELSLSRYDTASSKEYVPMEYDVEPLRRQDRAYVIETRRGDDVDVYIGGRGEKLRERSRDRDFRDDGRYIQVYDDYTRCVPPKRDKKYYRDDYEYDRRDEPRGSRKPIDVVERSGPYGFGALSLEDPPSRTVRQEIPRSSARVAEEDDWKVVNSRRSSSSQPSMFRDPFHENRPIDSRGRTRGRSFVQPSSDEEYVLVSPPRNNNGDRTEITGGTLRSALVRDDTYTPEERMYRRRSRSAHFREKDIPRHSVGEQKHERPGAEAAMMGRYLRHYDDRDDRNGYADYEYKEVRRQDTRDRDRDRDDRYVADSRVGYPPQMDSPPRRRRRKDHYGGYNEEDYYSDRVERKEKRYYR